MKSPVEYKGKSENGWHRYYIELPLPKTHRRLRPNGTVDYQLQVHEVILDKSRFLAWAASWWSWLMARTIGDEI